MSDCATCGGWLGEDPALAAMREAVPGSVGYYKAMASWSGEPCTCPSPQAEADSSERGDKVAEYAADNVVYVIAIRSAGPKNGREVKAALESIRDLVDPVCSPQVVAHRYDEQPAHANEALRTLGFDFDAANSIYVVASSEPQSPGTVERAREASSAQMAVEVAVHARPAPRRLARRLDVPSRRVVCVWRNAGALLFSPPEGDGMNTLWFMNCRGPAACCPQLGGRP